MKKLIIIFILDQLLARVEERYKAEYDKRTCNVKVKKRGGR